MVPLKIVTPVYMSSTPCLVSAWADKCLSLGLRHGSAHVVVHAVCSSFASQGVVFQQRVRNGSYWSVSGSRSVMSERTGGDVAYASGEGKDAEDELRQHRIVTCPSGCASHKVQCDTCAR